MIRRHFPRAVAAWGRLVVAVLDLRRAAWRARIEEILTTEHGWPTNLALLHVGFLEEVAGDLVAQGKLARWPTAREAVGKTVTRAVRAR